LEILFLDSSPSSHHERFFELFSSLGTVHSVYVDLLQEPPALQFDLIIFADLDVTVDYATKFVGPKVGLSWAWDLQQTLRQGLAVEEKLKKALKALDMLIVDCMSVEKIAKEFGLLDEQIFRVPYGIDIEKYPLRRIKNPGVRKLRLYSNRRWEGLYRPRILLDMAQHLHNCGKSFELILANDGSLREPLLSEYSSLFESGFCISLGKISQSQNISELEKADIYISASRSDGSSLSLLEAMAIGTPSIVTDNPENREWIEENVSGYLFSGDSGLELALKVLSIDLDPTLQQEMLESSREKIIKSADWSLNQMRLLEKVTKTLYGNHSD
jgi:glycosyltransferase involved in cell wall biosynthesis